MKVTSCYQYLLIVSTESYLEINNLCVVYYTMLPEFWGVVVRVGI